MKVCRGRIRFLQGCSPKRMFFLILTHVYERIDSTTVFNTYIFHFTVKLSTDALSQNGISNSKFT